MSDPFGIAVELLAEGPCAFSNLGYWASTTMPLRAPHQQASVEDKRPAEPGEAAHVAETPCLAQHDEPQAIRRRFLEYPEACERMASWVGQAAGVGAGQTLLDLCVGAGGSVRYWLERLDVSRVDAVELREGMLARLRAQPPDGLGTLICSDVEDPTLLRTVQPARYDAVLCLDALYHLRSPTTLWRLAAHALKPGGRLALCTLLRVGSRSPSTGLDAMLRLARIHAATLPSVPELTAQLDTAGFSPPKIVWANHEVLDGFAAFVARRAGQLPWGHRLRPGWLKIAATARLAKAIERDGALGYALVTTERNRSR